jgi:REP element-mobilizing transposase RayT
VEFPGAIYHVMSRGVARMAVFLDDSDRTNFLERIGSIVDDGRMVVHAFCLMPSHYHLLCETPGGGLRTLLREIDGGYARRFNRAHRRAGHL